MPKFKPGDRVRLPHVHTDTDVLQIIVKTVNDVTGLVQEVELIKANGTVEVMDVTNIIVTSIHIISRIIAWFQRLFRKR